MEIGANDALIVVDVQNDFCPGGSLAVKEGDKVVPILNQYIKVFSSKRGTIYATRDWHPTDHISFKEHGGSWPKHCVQRTLGAEFHPDLNISHNTPIISKGINSDEEAYSGFQGTDLEERLRIKGTEHLFIGGLATDYCVKNTILDALKAGFRVYLLKDASRGINLKPDDSRVAVEEMVKDGAVPITIDEISPQRVTA